MAVLVGGLVTVPSIGTADAASYSAPTMSASLTSLPAVQADSVVDAFGVGIHLPFLDTPYADATKVGDALVDLGVRHVRDDLYLNNPRQYAGIAALAQRGIKFNLIMGRPDKPGTPADYVNTVAALPAGSVESVEGINEWDLFGAGRPNWAAETAAWQKGLWEAMKAKPALAKLPVLSPSMAFRWNYQYLPDLSPWADVANAHMYPGGYKPGTEISNITNALRTVMPTQPVMTTEAGYHNATSTTNGHNPASESAMGVYLPRMLLEHYGRGQKRVYSYELIDEFVDTAKTNPEAHFGLLRRDWSPKPAYTAMRTLLGLLEDPGPAFTPTPLPLSASGWPTDGRYQVAQKRDGSYVVLLWRDAAVWDPVKRTALSVPTAQVGLTFGADYDIAVQPVNGSSVTRTTGRSVSVPVGAGVVAVSLKPRATATPTPTPTATATPTATPTPTPAATATPTPTATATPTPTATATPTVTVLAPTNVSATGGDRSAVVRWTTPSGSSPAGYKVTRSPGAVTKWLAPGTTSWQDTGLTNGTTYTYVVSAVRSDGSLVSAAPVYAKPAGKPGRPKLRSARVSGGALEVAWRPAYSNGRKVTSYKITVGQRTKVVSAKVLRSTLRKLPRRQRLQVTVRAYNAKGWGAAAYPTYVRRR